MLSKVVESVARLMARISNFFRNIQGKPGRSHLELISNKGLHVVPGKNYIRSKMPLYLLSMSKALAKTSQKKIQVWVKVVDEIPNYEILDEVKKPTLVEVPKVSAPEVSPALQAYTVSRS